MPPLVVSRCTGERVDAVVLRVPAVAFDPLPFDAVRLTCLDQFLPELGVLHRLFVRGSPAIPLPIVDPARNAVADILAVGMEFDPARTIQRFEAANRREQLHPVVGRERLAAAQFTLLFAHPQKHGPAPRARVSAAGAVGEQLDFRQLGQGAARAVA